MITFPKSLAAFRRIVNERGELVRGLNHANERRARTAIVRAAPAKAIRIVK